MPASPAILKARARPPERLMPVLSPRPYRCERTAPPFDPADHQWPSLWRRPLRAPEARRLRLGSRQPTSSCPYRGTGRQRADSCQTDTAAARPYPAVRLPGGAVVALEGRQRPKRLSARTSLFHRVGRIDDELVRLTANEVAVLGPALPFPVTVHRPCLLRPTTYLLRRMSSFGLTPNCSRST